MSVNSQEDGVRSITSSLEDDGKSAVACINFLLISAARHSTEGSVFNEELQQLGLPKDHAASMCSVLSNYSAQIRKKLMDLSLKSIPLLYKHSMQSAYSCLVFS